MQTFWQESFVLSSAVFCSPVPGQGFHNFIVMVFCSRSSQATFQIDYSNLKNIVLLAFYKTTLSYIYLKSDYKVKFNI